MEYVSDLHIYSVGVMKEMITIRRYISMNRQRKCKEITLLYIEVFLLS